MTNFDRCGWCKYYDVWKKTCSVKETQVNAKDEKCKAYISWDSLEED